MPCLRATVLIGHVLRCVPASCGQATEKNGWTGKLADWTPAKRSLFISMIDAVPPGAHGCTQTMCGGSESRCHR